MFRPKRVYTHRYMVDVCMMVQTAFRVPDGRWKLKVRWFLRSGMDMNITDRVTVVPEQVRNWREFYVRAF